MTNFVTWKRDTHAAARAAWERILDHSTVITVRRGSITLPPQTVRVIINGGAREDHDLRRGLDNTPALARAVVFGVRDHRDVPDTDLKRADRFVLHGAEYEIVFVTRHGGEVQAVCEARE